MLCRSCLGPLELSFSRKRSKRYTGEDGPTTQAITVVVGRCLEDGHYSTIFPDDIVKYKQYCISDIRSVLENKEDFSLACPRTIANWKSWYRGVWDAVVNNIQLYIGGILSKKDISIALLAFCKECGDDWLRYLLDIFSTDFNNFCMYFTVTSATIGLRSVNLCKPHVDEGAEAPNKGRKPP